MTVYRYHRGISLNVPFFSTPDGQLHQGEWSWWQKRGRDRKTFKFVWKGLDGRGFDTYRKVDDTDPEWGTGSEISIARRRHQEAVLVVTFADDLIKGQWAPGFDDPDGRWCRYLVDGQRPGITEPVIERQYMLPEMISKHGPPRADLVQVAAPISEVWQLREVTDADLAARRAIGDCRPPDCRVRT